MNIIHCEQMGFMPGIQRLNIGNYINRIHHINWSKEKNPHNCFEMLKFFDKILHSFLIKILEKISP